MMNDEERHAKPDLLQAPSDDELHRLSVHELEALIDWLNGEIVRTKEVLGSKQGALSDAEAFFKK